MKKRIKSGQEAIEFALISGLVFVVALGSVILFGDKISNFFTGGTVASTAANSAPLISKTNGGGAYNPDYETEAENPEVKVIEGVKVAYNPDGSLEFKIDGQRVNLSAEAMGYTNQMFGTSAFDQAIEATAASGDSFIISAIKKIISEEKAKYPDSDVPLELRFGPSDRSWDYKPEFNYSGTAEVNTAQIKVGNRMIIISNDQNCNNGCNHPGVYTIDGTYDPDNKTYNASVTSTIFSPYTTLKGTQGTLSASLDIDNGYSMSGAKYTQTGEIQEDNSINEDHPYTYTWNFDFNSTNKQFDI